MARSDYNECAQKRLISVIIPVYTSTPDHERFLVEALQSVAAQTYRPVELILIDDHSPIDIRPLVEDVSGLPELRIIHNEQNVGHVGSRNAGVKAARGDLVAFLDHDDVWLPDKLARQVAALDEHPDAAMVFCEVEITGLHDPGLYIDQSTVPDMPDLLWLATHNNCVISVSSVLVKKQAILDIGLFDSRYTSCDDFDAWLKIRMIAPIVHLREKLAIYRLHSHNVNYSVNSLNDNRLLTALLMRCWRRFGLRGKLAMLPVLARKFAGRAVYTAIRVAGSGNSSQEK